MLLGALPVAGVCGQAALPDETVSSNPPPAWVRPWEWQRPEGAEKETDSEGVRVLLRETQENPIRHEEYSRWVRLLENESGVQDSGSLAISFDPSYQTLVIHHVRVHRAGATFDRLNLSELKVIQPEPDLWGGLYTGRRTAVLFVEDLRVGDVLDYAYTVYGSNPVIGDHYSAVYLAQSYSAMDRLRVRVVWPSSRPLFLQQHLTEQAPRTDPWGAGREYVWDWEHLESLDYEDYQPLGNEPYPYVEFSDFDSWSRVVDWALPLYADVGENRSSEIMELVSGWRKAASDDEEAARAALQFVQDDLRYTGVELGPDSYRPAPPAQTLAKRYGDCKAKCLLFCTLMHGLGIEAWPALVNTTSREAVARRLPSPFAFNHVIVKLILEGRSVWVDPTCSSQGGTLWNRYLPPYGKALLIKDGVTELEDLPKPGPGQRLQEITTDFVLSDYQSPAQYTVKTVYYGGEADDIRDYLAGSTLGDVAEEDLNFNARYYPGITNPSPLRVQDDRELNRLTIIERYRVRDLWELNESTGQWEASFYPDSLFGVLTDPRTRVRKMPLRISYPLRREQTVTVHLPDDGWNIPTVNETVEHSAFRFTHRREGKGSTVRFRYACETLRPEIPAKQVAAYLSKVDEMSELLGDTLFRPDTSARSILARLNWLMVVLAGLTLGATGVGVVWVWRRIPRAEPPLSHGAPPLLSEQKLRGLGGWLILVGIGLVLNPFMILAQIGMGWESYFSQTVWQAVAVPQGTQYHPLWAPLLMLELLGNILFLGWLVLLLTLFFGKRKAFPTVYIAFLMANFLFVSLDTLGVELIPALAEKGGPGSARDVVRAAIGAAIWGSYMVKSRRVKLTFVN